jgi:hypothetical protein
MKWPGTNIEIFEKAYFDDWNEKAQKVSDLSNGLEK